MVGLIGVLALVMRSFLVCVGWFKFIHYCLELVWTKKKLIHTNSRHWLVFSFEIHDMYVYGIRYACPGCWSRPSLHGRDYAQPCANTRRILIETFTRSCGNTDTGRDTILTVRIAWRGEHCHNNMLSKTPPSRKQYLFSHSIYLLLLYGSIHFNSEGLQGVETGQTSEANETKSNRDWPFALYLQTGAAPAKMRRILERAIEPVECAIQLKL